ncbi:MAG: gliding motility-associated C-terminal domain-containing protein [Chitinophagales bacterium]|nr:gliding motility-associated C-terminal domain-containing protein [Chitinophagaceae bacterium]MCB9064352.1 gliding motility-associated C-terminal domain-containing protein [Chitinophagales bacterium]
MIPKKSFAVILFLLFTVPLTSYADHCAGGELVYEWLGGNTYKFTFKFYRDCTGVAAYNTHNLCIYNSCTQNMQTRQMRKIATLPDGRPNGSQVNAGCPGYPNKCDNRTAVLPGYEEWWYVDSLDLGATCDTWVFSVGVSARNRSQNMTGGLLYVEATLDNRNFSGNNSPNYTVKPVPYVCLNQQYTYNNGAVDAEKDSLAYEVILPYVSGNCSGTPTTANLQVKSPPLGIPNNPFQTNNTYSINGLTGNITFTPGELGAQTTAIRVKEFRNGKLVGSTMRDIQVQVLTCNSTTTNVDVDTTSFFNVTYNNGTIEACATSTIGFCYKTLAADPTAVLVVTDNSTYAMPGSTTSYTNLYTDSVRGCFTWSTTAADTGLKVLTIIVKDSTCRAPGIAVTQSFTLPILLKPAEIPKVTSPLILCQNTTAAPLTAVGNNLVWFTTPTGGTGSTTAPTPSTVNLGTTTYYVATIFGACTSDRAPIVVEVKGNTYTEIKTSPDTVCALEHVTIENVLGNTGNILNSWKLDGGRTINGDSTHKIVADWTTQGTKQVILTVSNDNCISKDTAYVHVWPTPNAFFEIDNNVCNGIEIPLLPFEDTGTYQWNVDEQSLNDTFFVNRYNLTWTSAGKKYLRLMLTNEYGCFDTHLDSVSVHDYPNARIINNNSDICVGKEFTLSTEEGYRQEYSWSPPQYFYTDNKATVTGRAERSGYIHLTVSNLWNCNSQDSIYLDVPACCEILMPGAFSPNNDGHNDIYKPVNGYKYKIATLLIANRRGQIVFEGNTSSQSWDGNLNGKPAGQDTYNYYVKYLCEDGTPKEKKGTFVLVR